jgi:hypothetical protein
LLSFWHFDFEGLHLVLNLVITLEFKDNDFFLGLLRSLNQWHELLDGGHLCCLDPRTSKYWAFAPIHGSRALVLNRGHGLALAELLFPSLVRIGVVLSRLGDVEPLLASLIKAMVLLWIQLRVVDRDCTSRTLLTLNKR